METFFIKALQLILALVILVTVHELGHYAFARFFGIKVNKFYLFFNPWFSLLKYNPMAGTLELLSSGDGKSLKTFRVGKPHQPRPDGKPTWRDTIYGLGWLPLGGYCAIAGMVDETQGKDQLAAEPQPWEFRSKAAWKRLLVMVAGVLMNFVIAIVIYIGIAFHWGSDKLPYENCTYGFNYSKEFTDCGFQRGDIIYAVNGQKVTGDEIGLKYDGFQEGAQYTVIRPNESGGKDTVIVTLSGAPMKAMISQGKDYQPYWAQVPTVIDKVQAGEPASKAGLQHGDRIVAINNTQTPFIEDFLPELPNHKETKVALGIIRDGKDTIIDCEVNSLGKIGIQMMPADSLFEMEHVEYTFLEAIPKGWNTGTEILATYVKSLGAVFSKEGAKQIGGFGTLGDQFSDHWDWKKFWYMTAFLSVILAFMNIIPIPALDGGYTMFLLWEIITRRKPSDKFLEIANMIGMGFLLLLLVYANANDIFRYIFK